MRPVFALLFCTATSALATDLKCAFKPVAPSLNFSLRMEAGYRLTFPFDEFQRAAPHLDVELRVRSLSRGASASVHADHFTLPPHTDSHFQGEVAGRFLLDSGSYEVQATATDDLGRTCRDEWRAEVKSGPVQRLARPPAPLNRLTVFLDAAPLSPRYPGLQATDVVILTSALSSLLEQLPANAVRLVMFNLDAETESRSNSFQLAEMKQVEDALNAVQLGTVDYKHLIHQRGSPAFLAGLVNRELREADRADEVIFLGPLARLHGKFPRIVLNASAPLPRFDYLQYRSAWRYFAGYSDSVMGDDASMGAGAGFPPMPLPPAELHDIISDAVEQFHGRTFILLTPNDFANALHRMVRKNAQ